MKKGIFVVMTLLMSLVSFRSAAVDADVLVRNQRFSQDTFFFDIFLQATGSQNLFLSHSDFTLNFTEANFSNPELHYVVGSASLFNAHGNPTNYYDTNIGTRIDYDGMNAFKLLIFVQMPVYSNATDFMDRIAHIDQQALTHSLGTFYITGATALNTNPQLSWATSGGGLVLKVNHRDSVTQVKSAATINAVNPSLQSDPATKASGLSATNVTSSGMTLYWTKGSGSKSMILVKESSEVDALPADGLYYEASTVFGEGDEIDTSDVYVLYTGTDSTVTISGLTASTTYYFAVITYNGSDGWSENYKTTSINPLVSAIDTQAQTTGGPSISANVKVFLHGPYNTGTSSMNTHLRMGNTNGSTNLLPAAHPYSGSPWNYSGTENVDTSRHPVTAVDWVLVELRSTYNGAAVDRAAGFILANGSIVDTNGVDAIRFWNVSSGYYYIVIKHRNHLAVMTKDSILLTANSNMYDFTTAITQAYGSGQRSLSGGKFAMHSGDVNSNNQVRYNGAAADRTAILAAVGLGTPNAVISNSYSKNDANLDRLVRYNGASADRVVVLGTVGLGTPNAIISTQVP